MNIKRMHLIILPLILSSCVIKTENLNQEILLHKSPPIRIINIFTKIDNYPVVIIPYFVNLYSIQLLKNQKNIKEIKQYIIWYLNHLNYPDKFGNTGSIYDYKIKKNNIEKSLNTFDSIDSYSSTFIELLYKYLIVTGDSDLISNNRKKIEDIAFLMPNLQGKDGLTIESQRTGIKYLMDNCEVYSGLKHMILLSNKMDWELNNYYQKVINKLKSGILTELYDKKNKIFFWAKVGSTKSKSVWSKFYPDAFAQLFPILYNIIPENDNVRKMLWKTFNKVHSDKLRNLPVEQNIIYNWTKEVVENEDND